MKLCDKRMLKRAERRIDKLMPGKTLDDVSKMYEQFYDELTRIKNDENSTSKDILACLDQYKDVLEIADLFPEEGTQSWESYRRTVEYISRQEEIEK